jgi:hypothetical protein
VTSKGFSREIKNILPWRPDFTRNSRCFVCTAQLISCSAVPSNHVKLGTWIPGGNGFTDSLGIEPIVIRIDKIFKKKKRDECE